MWNSLPLLAANGAHRDWPDRFDWPILIVFLTVIFTLPALGYVAMLADFRAYLHSLRGALVLVSNYRPELPAWVRRTTPNCILALGLTMPCTEEEVLAAYRRKVKQMHPDLGGDRREFLRLQAQFEEAMSLVAADSC